MSGAAIAAAGFVVICFCAADVSNRRADERRDAAAFPVAPQRNNETPPQSARSAIRLVGMKKRRGAHTRERRPVSSFTREARAQHACCTLLPWPLTRTTGAPRICVWLNLKGDQRVHVCVFKSGGLSTEQDFHAPTRLHKPGSTPKSGRADARHRV